MAIQGAAAGEKMKKLWKEGLANSRNCSKRNEKGRPHGRPPVRYPFRYIFRM
jgi:predicted ArsR family transcriptional regulator